MLNRVFFAGSRVPRHTRRMVKMGTARRTYSVGVVRFLWQFCGYGHRISIMWMASWKLRMALYILCTRYTVTNNVYAKEVCTINLCFALSRFSSYNMVYRLANVYFRVSNGWQTHHERRAQIHYRFDRSYWWQKRYMLNHFNFWFFHILFFI